MFTPPDVPTLQRRVRLARGIEPVDLLIRGARLVNVFSAEVHDADIAIADGRIVGWGAYEALETLEARGMYVTPGFIDAHIHIESTLLTPSELARVIVPLGTTTIIADPHEIANVLGRDGLAYMLAAAHGLPLDVFYMLPSCVPATDMETAGARLDAEALSPFLSDDRVLGLAEVMNYPGVLAADRAVLAKISLGLRKRVDGHAPGVHGLDLNAYVGVGIKSDHECTTATEALEKLRAGMHIFIREGSVAKNLEALLPVVNAANAVCCGLVSDDRHPMDLEAEGHVDHLLRRAVALGVPAITAIQMATINPAKYFFTADVGAVAPGYRADLVLLPDLQTFRPAVVIKSGRIVARDGHLTADLPTTPPAPPGAVHIAWNRIGSLEVAAVDGARGRIIQIVPDQLTTRSLTLPLTVRGGNAGADPSRDLCKLAVVEVRQIERLHGGMVAVCEARLLAAVALPIAGLMSDSPFASVVHDVRALLRSAAELGIQLRDPFMTLSFLALPVIPALRLTDRGLVDVERFEIVPLQVAA